MSPNYRNMKSSSSRISQSHARYKKNRATHRTTHDDDDGKDRNDDSDRSTPEMDPSMVMRELLDIGIYYVAGLFADLVFKLLGIEVPPEVHETRKIEIIKKFNALQRKRGREEIPIPEVTDRKETKARARVREAVEAMVTRLGLGCVGVKICSGDWSLRYNRNKVIHGIHARKVSPDFLQLALPKYSGDTYPNAHISMFEDVVRPYTLNPTQVSKAKLFVMTFEDNVMHWLEELPPGYVANYNRLVENFLQHFDRETYQVCQTGCRRIHPHSCEYYQKSPFSDHILREAKVMNPNVVLSRVLLKYRGEGDPKTHISMFEEVVLPYHLSGPVMAKLFVTTFDDKVMHWFGKLEPGSISSYSDLREKFIKTWDAWDGWKAGSKSPFSTQILTGMVNPDFVLPPGLLKYKGDIDPKAHVARFHEALRPYSLSPDSVIAKVFVMTFEDEVMRWFANLRPSSICSSCNLFKKFEEDWS